MLISKGTPNRGVKEQIFSRMIYETLLGMN